MFGSVYGGITAQTNNSQFLQKKHKKSDKYDDSVKPFPDSVTQYVFFSFTVDKNAVVQCCGFKNRGVFFLEQTKESHTYF